MVVVNPGTVMGPVIPSRLNASMLMLLRLLQGNALSVEYVLLPSNVMAMGMNNLVYRMEFQSIDLMYMNCLI